MKMKKVVSLVSVSYTHLDVYKRQVYILAGQGIGCGMIVDGKLLLLSLIHI